MAAARIHSIAIVHDILDARNESDVLTSKGIANGAAGPLSLNGDAAPQLSRFCHLCILQQFRNPNAGSANLPAVACGREDLRCAHLKGNPIRISMEQYSAVSGKGVRRRLPLRDHVPAEDAEPLRLAASPNTLQRVTIPSRFLSARHSTGLISLAAD